MDDRPRRHEVLPRAHLVRDRPLAPPRAHPLEPVQERVARAARAARPRLEVVAAYLIGLMPIVAVVLMGAGLLWIAAMHNAP